MSETARTYTEDEVREMLRKMCAAEGNITKWAGHRRVPNGLVGKFLNGERRLAHSIERGMGLKRVWVLDNGGRNG